MSFTDEDLKKVKAEINSTTGQTTILGTREMAHMFPEKLQALLTRLEAAEEVIEDFKLTTETEAPSIRAWRKAARK